MPVKQTSIVKGKIVTKKGGKERSFWDKIPGSKIASQTAKDFGEMARTAPGGIVQIERAIDKALPAGPGDKPGEKHNDYSDLKKIGAAQWEGIRDVVQHPLRNPGYSLVTALGLLAPAAGAGAKVGMLGKAGKISKASKGKKSFKQTHKELSDAAKNPTRTLRYRPKELDLDSKDQRTLRSISGRKDKPTIVELAVKVPASRRVTTRAVQKGTDKLRAKSYTLNRRKVLKQTARERDIIDRIERPNVQPGFKDAIREAGSKKSFATLKSPGQWVPEINAGVRGARLFRPGYILPNLLGSRATNLIEYGPVGAYKAAVRAKGYRGSGFKQKVMGRDISPEKQTRLDEIRGVMGEGAAQGASELGLKVDDVTGEITSGPVSTFMRGVGQSLGKATDRQGRDTGFHGEAARFGYKTDADIDRLLTSPRSRKDLIQISRRAEPAAIKFTRTRNLEGVPKSAAQKVDAKLAKNIFLYRWLTGSGQYTGRMLAEHPTLSMALANQGQISPKIDDVLKEYPKFLSNYIPAGVRGKLPLVSNMQAATLFGTPGDTVDLIKEIKKDPRNLIDPLAPAQRAVGVGALGYDPFRQQELSTRANPAPGLLDRLAFASDVETRSVPYRSLTEQFLTDPEDRAGKLFPRSDADLLKTFLLGGISPAPVNPEVATAMAKQQAEGNAPFKRRKRKKTNSGY